MPVIPPEGLKRQLSEGDILFLAVRMPVIPPEGLKHTLLAMSRPYDDGQNACYPA